MIPSGDKRTANYLNSVILLPIKKKYVVLINYDLTRKSIFGQTAELIVVTINMIILSKQFKNVRMI